MGRLFLCYDFLLNVVANPARIYFVYCCMLRLLKNVCCCLLVFSAMLSGCSNSDTQHLKSKDGVAVLPVAKAEEAVATFAGGCFWATQEAMLELKGVNTVVAGYAGGETSNPTYETVETKGTGHAEAVQVYYDPRVITFEKLVTAFFYAHDPTQVDGQGPDLGSDYRSIAFYRSPAEYRTISGVIETVNAAKHYPEPVVTEVVPFKAFYPAETGHQDYYPRNLWDPYIRNVSKPKIMKLRAAFPGLIKPGYLK